MDQNQIIKDWYDEVIKHLDIINKKEEKRNINRLKCRILNEDYRLKELFKDEIIELKDESVFGELKKDREKYSTLKDVLENKYPFLKTTIGTKE